MGSVHAQKPTEDTHQKNKLSITKIAAGIVVVVMIFGLGVGVGKGSINFNGKSRNNDISKDLPNDLDYKSVEEVYDALRKDFDGELDKEKLLEGLRAGLARATGDEYTEYLNAEAAKEFNEDLSGTFSGIGAELSKKEKSIIVVAPLSGQPAEKAGIRSQDVIAEIDGQSAYDLSVSEAVNKIRGQTGTKVKLKLVRGEGQVIDVEITRQQINIPSVESQILDGNIGYLKISRFAQDTQELAYKAADTFKQSGVRGVILDLRSDPGGLLDASVDVASLWLPKGKTVLQERRGDVVVKTYASNGRATLAGIRTVVLVNEGSASASEITAGALKDNGVATLIGTKTFGKGSVQHLVDLPDGSVLKVTIAKWFTPNGKNIDKEGLEPDQKVERSPEDIQNQRDPQKDAALKELQN